MFEVTFSDQSIAVINKLDLLDQLEIIDKMSNLSDEDLLEDNIHLGKFLREGKTYYRLRIFDFRVYFEKMKNQIHAHYFLHKNTWSDFVFRCKLPVTDELLIEQDQTFWKYLENLRNK